MAGLSLAGDGYKYVRLIGGETAVEQDQDYKYVSLIGGHTVIETAEGAAPAARRMWVVN